MAHSANIWIMSINKALTDIGFNTYHLFEQGLACIRCSPLQIILYKLGIFNYINNKYCFFKKIEEDTILSTFYYKDKYYRNIHCKIAYQDLSMLNSFYGKFGILYKNYNIQYCNFKHKHHGNIKSLKNKKCMI